MKSVLYNGLLPLLLLSFIFVRCNKDDHPQQGNNTSLFRTGRTMISGVVVDANNQPVSRAGIVFKNQTYFSDDNGMFMLPEMEVDADRTYIICKKDGYFNSARATETVDGGLTYFIIRLVKKNNIKQFTAANGINATIDNGAKVQIPASAIVNANGQVYSGTVVMTSRYIDPTVRNFSEYMPGGDFEAVTTENREVELYSFGASEVLLEGTAQQKLQLKAGTEATLTLPIAASQLASAPTTIPLWYFDEQKGKWIEEGSASRQGNVYVGKVKHFSSWNADKPLPRAKVYGRVRYCDGTPARGINVSIGGQTAITNHNGDYELTVFAGEQMAGWADYSYDHSMGHVSKDISALAEGERRNIDFTFDCMGAFEGTLYNCNGSVVEPGMIVVRWATGFGTATTDASGRFRLTIPGNTDITVSGIGVDGGILNGMTFTTPASGNEKIDMLRLCRQPDVQDGEVIFTLDGAGYNNETITVKSDLAVIPDAVYHRLDDETRLNKTGTNGYGFGAVFEGKEKGTFPEATVFLVYAKQTQGGTTQMTFTPVEDKTSFTVTLYGAVGEVIAGTFSGTFVKRTGSDPNGVEMQVRNGRFSLRRSPDED
ncbi:MAG: hypothetical protein DI535_26100 [Citrobacter freundii]|nr:MAG: hypothetical protein DI535_26100 [Citrobacter freundii]